MLLDEPIASVAGPLTTPRAVFQRVLLFRLAAPCRMSLPEMQCLFDWLTVHAGSVDWANDHGYGRLLFRFEATRPGVAVPHLAAEAPFRADHFAMAKMQLGDSLFERLGVECGNGDGLIRALPRLGRPLRCGENSVEEPVQFLVGFKAVAMALRFMEARALPRGGADYWPPLGRIDFAPLDDDPPDSAQEPDGAVVPSDTRPGTLETGPHADRGLTEAVPAEIPGFFLLDTGCEGLRAGHLLGIRKGENKFGLAAVRAGQVHEGRFRHTVEVIGNSPELVSVRRVGAALESYRSGFVMDAQDDPGGMSLVVSPVRWKYGDALRVDRFRRHDVFQVGRLLEWAGDFCHFELVEAGPPEREPRGIARSG